jgi:hypothetical protein
MYEQERHDGNQIAMYRYLLSMSPFGKTWACIESSIS